MKRYGIAALAAFIVTGAGHAAGLSPTDIIRRHTSAVAQSNVDAMMADYADDAIVLEAGQAIQGKAAIRALFTRMFPPPAPGAPPAGTAAMKITKSWQEGDVGFFTWELPTVRGTDEFIVHRGKIQVQAVFLSAAPAPSAGPNGSPR